MLIDRYLSRTYWPHVSKTNKTNAWLSNALDKTANMIMMSLGRYPPCQSTAKMLFS
jgi:hypothetical protein